MLGDRRIRRERQLFERRAKTLGSGVAHGDGDVAQKSGIARPADGAPGEHGAEFVFRNGGELLERWRKMGGLKSGLRGHRRALVPRADVLADVAAEDVAADARAR